jgi:hypothetical protein
VELRVHHRSAGEIVAELGPVLLRLVNGVETTHESIDRLAALLDSLVARWPLVGALILVEHGTPTPALEIRRRADEVMSSHGDRLVIGYAFLGLGFWTADARGFAAERAALGLSVFAAGTVHELVSRVSLELVGVDPELIERSCEQLRAELVR